MATDASYRGRVTVPVLWDTETKRIVSNDDDDIMRMFETEFGEFASGRYDFYPEPFASGDRRTQRRDLCEDQ